MADNPMTLERIAQLRCDTHILNGPQIQAKPQIAFFMEWLRDMPSLCDLAETALKQPRTHETAGPCTCGVVILEGGFAYEPDVPEGAELRIEYCEHHKQPRTQWQDISSAPRSAVLVSRPTDEEIYRPTAAFLDATDEWRVFRSPGGNTILPFVPTHWMELPEPPEASRE